MIYKIPVTRPSRFFQTYGLRKIKMAGLYFLIFVLCLPNHGWTYVDPGSINLFLQVIVAFVLGALISLRTRLVSMLRYLSNLVFANKKCDYDEYTEENKK